MHLPLYNKRILLLSPAFFNYENIIKEKMEQLGAIVKFYDERAVKTAFEKALLKISPKIFTRKAYKYYQTIIDENKGSNFDFIVIIKCDMVSIRTINELRLSFPKAKMCLHIWDSVRNIPNISEKIKYFDYASSFDRNDCMKDLGLHFRPLFFSDDFCGKTDDNKNFQFDVVFCGTIHSDRLYILKTIEHQCMKLNLKYYKYYYLQSRFIYYYYKLTKKSFRDTKYEDFSYIKKNHKEIAEIEDAARIIIDIQHPAQSGLTMRTIEMVGLRKKLITTNAEIVNYDFYDSSNICIINRNSPVLDQNFISVPYKELPDSIYQKYSLCQWILDILGIGDKVI